MKFVPLRDMRNHPKAVLNQLKKEKEIILTSHGKPVALMADLSEETFEENLTQYRRNHEKLPGQAAESAASYFTEDPEILKAWIVECEKRYKDFLDGKTKGISADKVFAQLRKQLRKK